MESLRFFNILKLWVNKYYVVSNSYFCLQLLEMQARIHCISF